MPEDLDTVLARIVAHAKVQMDCVERAVQSQEYETAEFCAGVLSHDVIVLRQLLNHKLRYLAAQRQG